MSTSPSVVLNDLSFEWSDGTPVLSGLNGSFARTKTGLIGANGAGKSTLLKLIAANLRPSGGSISTAGVVDYLPQDVSTGNRTIAELLKISEIRKALRAVEAGSIDPENFDQIGDSWDIESRAVAALAALGLPTELDRSAATLSGGEAMLTAICGVRLRRADIALLDEPTNNLDRLARERLYDIVRLWPGTLIVVSHDLELLDLLDQTAELRAGELTSFGGNYSAYRDWLAVQQAAAVQAVRSAEQELKRQKLERVKAEERISHSERQGRKDRENRKYVGMIVDKRRNAAEKSQGSKRSAATARVDAAQTALAATEKQVRDDDVLKLDLIDPKLASTKQVACLPSSDGRDFWIRGPQRVGLIGANGVGKSRLLEQLLPGVSVPVAYLPQRIDLEPGRSVLETVRSAAPEVRLNELLNQMARLLVRGEMVNRPVETLSGGERLRVGLAQALFATPPPGMLVLDEPTNDLDLVSIEQLVAALKAYRGALLVVSHDQHFLNKLELSDVLQLELGGVLAPVSQRDDPA